MISCPLCHKTVQVDRTTCRCCAVRFEGDFHLPRLARLSPDHQRLAEALVMSGGNLKELTIKLDVSYPTLRKRVDSLIEELTGLRDTDETKTESILADIESGRIAADEGLRLIKEINGEL